jgi:curved DNA-binding protein CbpA
MSDETYYTVLNVKETASPAEIKTAYRDLIRQVHPDTIANLATLSEAHSGGESERDYRSAHGTFKSRQTP